MDELTLDLRLYSPRWGHEDTYEVTFTRESLEIQKAPRSAKCIYREGLDPEWQGDDLISMLENDAIYPPAVLPRLFVHAWLSWRSYELNDDDVPIELENVADWLNEISRAKPSSAFWRGHF